MIEQTPKLGDTRADNSKVRHPKEVYTNQGWVPFYCDYCGGETATSAPFDRCPECGADYTVETHILIRGR